jgi:hypothetical protein
VCHLNRRPRSLPCYSGSEWGRRAPETKDIAGWQPADPEARVALDASTGLAEWSSIPVLISGVASLVASNAVLYCSDLCMVSTSTCTDGLVEHPDIDVGRTRNA